MLLVVCSVDVSLNDVYKIRLAAWRNLDTGVLKLTQTHFCC